MSNRQYPYQQYPWYGGQYQQPGGYPGSPPSYGPPQHGTTGQQHQPYGSSQHGTTGQQHQHYGPPGAPPSFVPQHATGHLGAYAVDPGAIRPCIHQFIYIWPEHGHGFWAWLTYVGRRSVAGFRWTGYRWVYFGMDTRQIQSFYCH
ncbi:transporter [Fictibacillus sp. Mic-4]|uniref:transporter n=1 Tax=Fictibacillus sp. Mic-4 TaxID=3132826 RepID=UPI003CF2ABBE